MTARLFAYGFRLFFLGVGLCALAYAQKIDPSEVVMSVIATSRHRGIVGARRPDDKGGHDMSKSTGIFLTEPDAARLERSIIQVWLRSPTEAPDAIELEAILDQAEVVPSTAVDRHLVTMNSVVLLEDRRSSHRMTVTLVYPGEADPDCLRISVLSSFGRALIGAHVGDVINATFAENPSGKFVVAELIYQPEAAGRFDL